ncbi:MAG TPA: TonB-dependent receptor [Sphingobacterium sp.]|nr:TonB-dependent receptor [Sphingobacterium sp.]
MKLKPLYLKKMGKKTFDLLTRCVEFIRCTVDNYRVFKAIALKTSTLYCILMISIFSVTADTLAQNVSLVGEKITLKQFIKEISSKTDYRFIYTDDHLKASRPIDLHLAKVPLKEALSTYFKDQHISYSIKDHSIILRVDNTKNDTDKVPVQQQQDRVKGVVSLETAGKLESASGVSIRIKGTQRMTLTSANGEFSIRASKGDVIVFSMLGFGSEEVLVDSEDDIKVVLKESTQDLDDVVVTGYQTQERRTLTGSMGQLKAAEFEHMPIQSFDQAMQGRMSGVLVQGGSGVPGGPMKVEIRGQGSISAGTQPLYIVDGAEINSEDAASNVTASNPLSFLNPDDIESIEVLKDAAAASIYGAQAANGVVLITTKSGKAGKTTFSANYYKGITEPMPLIDMMNSQQYLDVRMEAVGNLNPTWTSEQIRTAVLKEAQLPITMTDSEIASLPTYDWQSEAFQTGFTDNVQLVASGGSETTTFRLSASYNKTDGNVIGNQFTRGTAYLRLNHDVSNKLKLWFSANLSSVKQDGSYRSWGSYSYLSSPQYAAPLILPFVPIYLEDGSFNNPYDRFPGNLPYNVAQVADVNTQQARTNNMLGNFRLTYNILPNLTFQSRFGLNYRVYRTEFYIDPRTQEAYAREGYKSFRMQPSTTFTTSHTLVYDKSLRGGHNLNALLGLEFRAYDRYRVGATSEGYPSHQFRYVGSAANILSAYENTTANKRLGFFTQIDYNYLKKYMLSGVLRYDGSSRFGENNRFGLFPSISGAWDASQEYFLRDEDWVQQLKLRIGYGETGNSAIGNFASRALWDGSGSHGGAPGVVMSQMGNDELRWERNVSTNLGLDFSFFKRKLYGSVDIFRRKSADLIIRTPLPWTSGFANVYRNVGEVVNKGLEIELNSDIIRTDNFKWTSGFNITFLRNKVTKLYKGIVEDGDDEDLDAPVSDDVTALPGSPGIRLGYPLHTNFRSQYAGVNAATGKPMWWYGEDRLTYSPGSQGSGSYTPHGRGNRLSDYFGGFVNTFNYKGVELGVFFQYDMGRELYNNSNTRFYRNGMTQSNSSQRAYEERWLNPGQITVFPRPIDGGTEELAASMDLSSTRFLEDASYIRLKELSLGYKVPKNFLERYRVNSLEIYARATNVLTFTKWTGYDPEFYIDDSNFTSNTGQIPQTRYYTMGIKVGF